MNVLLHFYPGDRVVWMAVGVLIQVTVVSSAALLFARCVAKYKPAVRHGILVCGLLCVLVSPALTVVFNVAGFRLIEPSLVQGVGWSGPIRRASGGRLRPEIDESRLTAPAFPKEAEALDALRKRSEWGEDASRKAERLDVADMLRAAGGALTVLWSGVAVVLLVRSIRGWRALMALRRGCQTLADPRVAAVLRSVVDSLRMRNVPAVACSAKTGTAITVGTVQPVILLPDALVKSVSDEELKQVLLHECAHIMRRDCRTGLLQRMVQIIYWPHPLIYSLNREIGRAREEVCDNYVLNWSDRTAYGTTLLRLSELCAHGGVVPSALGLLPRRWKLEQRVGGILDPRRTLMTRTSYLMSIGVMSGLVLVVFAIAGMPLVGPTADGSAGPAKVVHGQQDPNAMRGKCATIEQSLAACPKVNLRPGSVTVEGRCHDGKGNALAGVDVALFYSDYRTNTSGFVARTKSDEQGRFRFSDLEKPKREEERYVHYCVVAWSPDRPSAFGGFIYPPHSPPLDLEMSESATVKGRVTDAEGNPIEGVLVRFDPGLPHPIEGLLSDRTDSNGTFAVTDLKPKSPEDYIQRLPDGHRIVPAFHFRVQHPRYETRRVRYDGVPNEVDVVLRPGGVIVGRVVYGDSGRPAARMRVQLQGAQDHDQNEDNDPTDGAQSVTDEDGRYRLASLSAGKYNVWVTASDWTVVALDSIEVKAGQTREAPELKLIKGGFLAGRLTDATTGKPVLVGDAFVSIGVYGPSRPRSGAAIYGGRVAPDGTFRFRLPPGRHYVYMSGTGPFSVQGAKRGARYVQIRSGETTETVFRVSR